MSITKIYLSGKKDSKTGAELAWKINASKLSAEKYPNGPHATIQGTKKGEKLSVLQIPLFPSNVSARAFTTLEDVQAVAQTQFNGWVIRSANEQAKVAAEEAAKSYARDVESFAGESLNFDGTAIDIFAAPVERVERVASAKMQFSSSLSKVEGLENLSDTDQLAALRALYAEIKRIASN